MHSSPKPWDYPQCISSAEWIKGRDAVSGAPLRRSKRKAALIASGKLFDSPALKPWYLDAGCEKWADVVQAQLDGKLSRDDQTRFSQLTWFTSWREEAIRLNLNPCETAPRPTRPNS